MNARNIAKLRVFKPSLSFLAPVELFKELWLAHRFPERHVVADVLPRPSVGHAVQHDRLYSRQWAPFA